MDPDKRKYQRIERTFKLNYSTEQNGIASFAKDVSIGGVSFATNELLSVGMLLTLVFSVEGLPNEISANGKVVRAWQVGEACYAAVEFEGDKDLSGLGNIIG